MEEFERVCCVRGYHVYKEIWEAATGEILICEREFHNGRNRYAVAVKKSSCIGRASCLSLCSQERLLLKKTTTP